MNLLDILTIASYIALNVDVLFQIHKIFETKSCDDISLIGLAVRYAAILIILIKFLSLSELPLILGQVLLTVTFTFYLALVGHYFIKCKRKN